mmetsp:Transcript_43142/g.108978  ORF Transcript_43142/g.108978 Transcript_43142/m.108978 type:complete len:429 (+) Transcript_43142:188-1474(+)
MHQESVFDESAGDLTSVELVQMECGVSVAGDAKKHLAITVTAFQTIRSSHTQQSSKRGLRQTQTMQGQYQGELALPVLLRGVWADKGTLRLQVVEGALTDQILERARWARCGQHRVGQRLERLFQQFVEASGDRRLDGLCLGGHALDQLQLHLRQAHVVVFSLYPIGDETMLDHLLEALVTETRFHLEEAIAKLCKCWWLTFTAETELSKLGRAATQHLGGVLDLSQLSDVQIILVQTVLGHVVLTRQAPNQVADVLFVEILMLCFGAYHHTRLFGHEGETVLIFVEVERFQQLFQIGKRNFCTKVFFQCFSRSLFELLDRFLELILNSFSCEVTSEQLLVPFLSLHLGVDRSCNLGLSLGTKLLSDLFPLVSSLLCKFTHHGFSLGEDRSLKGTFPQEKVSTHTGHTSAVYIVRTQHHRNGFSGVLL